MTLAALFCAILCSLAGIALLRTACVKRVGGWRILAGWLVLASGAPAWRLTSCGWGIAATLAALTSALIALAFVAAAADFTPKKIRRAKQRRPAEPPAWSGPLWRGVVRTLLAGPAAGVAAVSLAAAVALRAPWAEADRLVTAGFLAPLAWAIGGVWATTDERLRRVGVGLFIVAGASLGWAKL